MKLRLNKYLALCGMGSRRTNSQRLQQGLFKINGETANPGDFIDTETDTLTYEGEVIKPATLPIYIALNKPAGYVTTLEDDRDRKTVMDLIDIKERIFPIGRLDKDSTGLLLLTNDGDLSYRLTHPKHHIAKAYIVETNHDIYDTQLSKLEKGVEIYDTKTMPAETKRLGKNKFQITLHQGMKRQIREMCRTVGLRVITLNRISIGPVKLGDLKLGEYRYLKEDELEKLKIGNY